MIGSPPTVMKVGTCLLDDLRAIPRWRSADDGGHLVAEDELGDDRLGWSPVSPMINSMGRPLMPSC
jgi:hypothetical protein